MKTSIIVSTFAVLTLMVTLIEAPIRHNAENNNVTSTSNYSYLPESLVSTEPAMKSLASNRKESTVKTSLPSAKDLSYLKFDVSDYSNDEHMATEVNNENSLEYLKFDVNEYTTSDETASYESIELPVNNFDYLKFDVNDYTSSDETASYESIELPVNEFEYLSFDVSKYSNENHVNIGELPVAE